MRISYSVCTTYHYFYSTTKTICAWFGCRRREGLIMIFIFENIICLLYIVNYYWSSVVRFMINQIEIWSIVPHLCFEHKSEIEVCAVKNKASPAKMNIVCCYLERYLYFHKIAPKRSIIKVRFILASKKIDHFCLLLSPSIYYHVRSMR